MAKIKPMRSSLIFKSLSDKELAHFSRIVTEEEYAPDTVLFAQKMKSDTFYLIEKGEVEISADLDGGGKKSIILGDGDAFGEWSILAPRHLTATSAKVVNSSNLLLLEISDFEKFAKDEPAVAIKVYKGLIEMVWKTVEEIRDMLLGK